MISISLEFPVVSVADPDRPVFWCQKIDSVDRSSTASFVALSEAASVNRSNVLIARNRCRFTTSLCAH